MNIHKRFIRAKKSSNLSIPQSETHVDEEKYYKSIITLINYDEKTFIEKEIQDISECFEYRDMGKTTWINIDGPPLSEIINPLGKHFNLHPLVLEDIRTEQRPKIEEYENYTYVVLRALNFNRETIEIENEQVSLILSKNFVISFQEQERNVLFYVRERIRSPKSRARYHGTDYLLYTLIDVIVDNYFNILERIGEKIEELEEKLISSPTDADLKTLHHLKREMIVMRKSTWPLREIISRLHRTECAFISSDISHFLRDVYDHTIQVIDTVETFRDTISGIWDLYHSSVTKKTNDIMKTLAIAATIFAPLTFLTGIWGMNFKDMPDLSWRFGYPLALSIMLTVVIIMLFYFKKRKWI